MADPSPLIVPIQVDALVVNDPMRHSAIDPEHPLHPAPGWVRTNMQYVNLANPGTAEPVPENTDPGFISFGNAGPGQNVPAGAYYNGVYLKWRLPAALAHGMQDGAAGTTVFPPLPNRWLVVRTGDGTAPAWVVESDYSWPDGPQAPTSVSQAGSLYLSPADPGGNAPDACYIGRNVALGGAEWTEPGTSLGLTAMAPGNPGFTAYQPACNNVFSMVDTLDGVEAATFSYLVVGWYGVPGQDVLATLLGAEGLPAALDELKWVLAPGADPAAAPSWTLYAGYVTGVAWQKTARPPGNVPATPVCVAVGDTSVAALTALVAQQAAAVPVQVQADLFEAFQLDMVSALDRPDGLALLAERVRDSAFQMTDGGHGWDIVDAPGAAGAVTAAELQRERTWLAALNAAQAQVDDARRTLAGLRARLFVEWWKYLYWEWSMDTPPVGTQADVQARLDPTVPGSLAFQVAARQKAVNDALVQQAIPAGDTPDALAAAIQAYALGKGLSPSRQLKRFGLPRFALANNPVLLISGAGSGGIRTSGGTLVCRLPGQVAASLTAGGKTATPGTPGLTIPLPALSGVRGAPWPAALVNSLVQEMFFQDPANASAIAAAMGVDGAEVLQAQAPPPGTGAPWTRNPWRPLYLFWQAQYYPIARGAPASPSWSFDGTGYGWNGSGASASPLTLQGRILLTSAAAYNLQARLQSYLAAAPDLDGDERAAFEALLSFVGSHDPPAPGETRWDLLSQALDGFNDQLLLRMNGATVSPGIGLQGLNASVPALIGNAVGRAPALEGGTFPPWRSGQFYFQSLQVVDEWGQSISPVTPANHTHVTLFRSPGLTPATPVFPGTGIDFVQLQPRILQPARLNFELLSATDDTRVLGLAPDVNPICGWVLPNHLDAALAAYDAQGRAMGELSAGISVLDQAEVCWTPAPGSPWATVNDLMDGPPHFGPFLAALAGKGTGIFRAFLAAVDETLWTTLPAGAAFDTGLSVLMGRPLAMVRARVGFGLDGPPITDPGWVPAPTAFTGYTFPVRLGNAAQLEDGLIGYFTDAGGFGAFNVVQQSGAAADGYLNPIGENGNYVVLPFDGQTVAHVSMLVDPRAGVHATTGVLPTAVVALPPGLVTAALAAMEVTFRAGPILTAAQLPVLEGGLPGPATVQLPLPAQDGAAWSWMQNEGGAWKGYATASPDTAAHLSSVPPVLRRGLLKLSLPPPD